MSSPMLVVYLEALLQLQDFLPRRFNYVVMLDHLGGQSAVVQSSILLLEALYGPLLLFCSRSRLRLRVNCVQGISADSDAVACASSPWPFGKVTNFTSRPMLIKGQSSFNTIEQVVLRIILGKFQRDDS